MRVLCRAVPVIALRGKRACSGVEHPDPSVLRVETVSLSVWGGGGGMICKGDLVGGDDAVPAT